MPARCRWIAWVWLVCLVSIPALPVAAEIHFESGPVHPVAVSPNGRRLLVVHPRDATVELIRREDDGKLVPYGRLPVGLEPVSVRWQDDRIAWIVNRISGSVTRIDALKPAVLQTLQAGAAPADVAFAGGRAFVSVTGEDALYVYELALLDSKPRRIELAGRTPRTLASARDGSRVHGVFLLSGNGTRVLAAATIHNPQGGLVASRLLALGGADPRCAARLPPEPELPAGVVRGAAAPRLGRILGWDAEAAQWVDAAGRSYAACGWAPPREADVFEIDSASLSVRYRDGVGTVLYDLALHPRDGSAWIPHTEARNRIRFEHAAGLKNRIADQRLARLDPAGGLQQIDLNPHLPASRSDPSAVEASARASARSIALPVAMAWEPSGSAAWIAAMGSGEAVRLDAEGSPTDARVDTGGLPVGLALDPQGRSLYVLDAMSHALLSIELSPSKTPTVVQRLALPNPEPLARRQGRRSLYDARAGSRWGDASCAVCHVYGDRDGLAWDLGNPAGEFVPYRTDAPRFVRPTPGGPQPCRAEGCAQESGFTAEKGPMATQTLRATREPLHWRGDRDGMAAFNRVFVELLGREDLSAPPSAPQGIDAASMGRLAAFLGDLQHPPNPLRSAGDAPPNEPIRVPGTAFRGTPSTGEQVFRSARSPQGNRCVSCHAAADGSADGALTDGRGVGAPSGDFKVPALSGLHEKHLRPGFAHEGAAPTLAEFLASDEFDLTPQQSRDLAAYLVSFPSRVSSSVGREAGPEAGEFDGCRWVSRWGDAGRLRGALHDAGSWRADRGDGSAPADRSAALRGRFVCVPHDWATRIALDRDGDGLHNGDDCAPDDSRLLRKPSGGLRIDAIPDPSGQSRFRGEALDRWFGTATELRWVSGDLEALRDRGVAAAAGPADGSDEAAASRLAPGKGRFYLAEAVNGCGRGGFGVKREALSSSAEPSASRLRQALPAE